MDLRNNRLTSDTVLHDALFNGNVGVLDLGCNKLARLPPALHMSRLTALSGLDLRNNCIAYSECVAVDGEGKYNGLAALHSLTYLNLRNNKLQNVPPL